MKLITLQDTFLKQGTKQSLEYPAGEKQFLPAGTVLPISAVKRVGLHYKITLGKDSHGKQLSYKGKNTWYAYSLHVQVEPPVDTNPVVPADGAAIAGAMLSAETNQAGIELIKHFEGLKLKAYRCPANIPTIGYGHTVGVRMGDEITVEQAERYLREDLKKFEKSVRELVTVSINSNQFSALVSFSYNLGSEALRVSTLLKLMNRGDYQGAADEFLKWNKALVDGKMKVLEGLTRRRQAERQLFLRPV